MHKKEMISYLATEVGVPLSTANKFLDKLSEKIRSEVSQGSKVSIPGLGIFEASIRGELRQYNIATNKVGVVAERILPVFRAAKKFKKEVQ